MNRYLIAALYVMAGCAVTIPLKAPGNGELLRGERCRSIVIHTVKVVSVCMQEKLKEQELCSHLISEYVHMPIPEIHASHFLFKKTVGINNGSLCRTSHKIRAPEHA